MSDPNPVTPPEQTLGQAFDDPTDRSMIGDLSVPLDQEQDRQVLYRKWRPRNFADVLGQEPITTTLLNAVIAAAPAHAYLFSGPRGTGKTSTARILARAANCESPVEGEPDNQCSNCIAFLAGEPLDLIELDAASNRGIDEVRQLRESVGISPNRARYKVYLIDEVHMLTEPAFNALLKTLEEPPPHVIFVLATTEPHKLPPTIVSRCQRFDFRRVSVNAVVQRLETIIAGESVSVSDGGLDLIARQATGSLRDAINLLDQMIAYHGRTLTMDSVRAGLGLVVDNRAISLAAAALKKELGIVLSLLDAVREDGIEVRSFVRQVVTALRAVMMMKAGDRDQTELADVDAAELQALADDVSVTEIVSTLRVLVEIDFRGDAYDSLPVEIAIASLIVSGNPTGTDLAVQTGDLNSVVSESETNELRSPAATTEVQAHDQKNRDRTEVSSSPDIEQSESVSGRRVQRDVVLPEEESANPEMVLLRSKWSDIREAARKRNHRAGAMLNSQCYIKKFEGDIVEIGFRSPFLIEKIMTLEEGKVMQAIRDVVCEAVGRAVEVVPVLWEELQTSSGVSHSSSETRTSATGGHLVEEAQKLGASRFDVDRNEE